jgi:hypothetical protein
MSGRSTLPSPARRTAGERIIDLIETGSFPFDGSHTSFRPGLGWPVPRLSEDLE